MIGRAFKYLAFASVVAAGVSACNGLSGVHMNSQVLQGQDGGFRLEPATPRAPDAPPEVESQPLRDGAETLAAADLPDARQPAQPSGVEPAPTPAKPSESRPSAPAPVTQPRAVAPVASSAPSFVGQKTTVVGLGDPGRDGLWMETPLVSARRNARVTAPNGRSVVVTLEPISGEDGSGSRLSIGGMRALGLPLTELVEVRVGPV